MSVVYYFETEKRNVRDYPSNKKYVCIAEPVKPTPENGKKRLSVEQKKKYESDVAKYNKCIEMLESGHVNMNNNSLEPENSENFAVRMLLEGISDRYRLFRIKPIQSNTIREYYNRDTLVVSEFDVEKEIKTSDELLDILVENYEYFCLENKIFAEYQYANHREQVLNVFRKLYEKTSESRFLEDLIHDYFCGIGNEINVHSYSETGNKACHDFANQLMDLGYVKLYYDKTSYVDRYIIRLLKLKWTDFALEVVKTFVNNEEQFKSIKENKDVQALLSGLTDDSNVKEIIKLLNVDTNKLILVVEEDTDDGYITREVERTTFTDMGVLRSYLITEYKMPFDKASGELDYVYWNDMIFSVEQEK